MFSRAVLRESLAFGLPRLPHALAQQVMAVGDRFILSRFGTLTDIGVYSMSVSFGLIPKLFLSAFENAWAPFYYATAREPDGARTFSGVTTYVFAVLALLTAGLAAIAADLLALVVGPAYAAGAGVVAWTAVGVLLPGRLPADVDRPQHHQAHAVLSGLDVAGAGCNVGLNFVLIPRFGIIGAAWANAAAYGVQAAVAYRFSQRFYPIAYEAGTPGARRRAPASIAYRAARRAARRCAPLAGLLLRGTTVVAVMAALLRLSGFFRPDELRGAAAAAAQRAPARRRRRRPRHDRDGRRDRDDRHPGRRAIAGRRAERRDDMTGAAPRARRRSCAGALALRADRPAVRPAGRLQPGRSRDHGARAELRAGAR